jgi:putative nucleotidyltransferase with HDIG domain
MGSSYGQTFLYGAILAFMAIMEAKNSQLKGHAERVTRIAVELGKELKLPDGDLDALRLAAQVHDVGKLLIPDEILYKAGKLSEAEWGVIKRHVADGVRILQSCLFPPAIEEIVAQHHERIDGSGYPQGLTGPQIVLLARILAVSDVVAAMTCDRPYRQGLYLGEVVSELAKGAGKAFDERVIEALGRITASV